MRVIFNKRDEKTKRQQLRNEAPVAERLLWKHLRGEDAQAYDELRQREIESLGVRFIRVANEDIYRDALDVAASIALVVVELDEASTHTPSVAPRHLPLREGENAS